MSESAPRPREPLTAGDERAEAMRGRIRAAAIELFGTQGYGSTGLREIADIAAVNVASIYHYFRSKEDLLVSIIEELYRDTYAPAAEIVERAPGSAAALVALTRHHVAIHCQQAAAATISDRELGVLKVPARQRILALRDGYEQLWAELLARGVEEGAFRVDDPEVTRLAVLGMCSQVAGWYRPGGRLDAAELADAYARLVLRIVGYRRPES